MVPTYTGSCTCNAIQVELQGEPKRVGLCHCRNCRKLTGSTYSTNAVFSASALSIVRGKPKVFETQGGSGNSAFVHFCDHCSVTIWTSAPTWDDIAVIKVGVLDGDAMDKLIPNLEMFTTRKPGWVKAVDGTTQCPESFQAPPES